MVEVEAESADFDRFAAAFVLAGIDTGIQKVQDLIVAGEK
jgi:hypothetical protein